MARVRNKEYNTVHHLTSRIAHRVFFLKEEERNDFVSLMMRVSAFSGVELIGWCIMNNHFHIYVYLPEPPQMTDDEVLERFRALKGDAERIFADDGSGTGCPTLSAKMTGEGFGTECPTLGARMDEARAEARAERVAAIRRRMYSIAEYMRMIKQWFSEDYNRRNGHKGTMWEAIYGDHAMSLPEDADGYEDIRDVLAYIHLNPIRAAMTDRFDGYAWSSYAAYRNGDPVAVKAMRLAYAGYEDDAEIAKVHEGRMARLLEDWKRRRAETIARKTANGYRLPHDTLTDEAMVAQAAAHLAEVQRESERLNAERQMAEGRQRRKELVCNQILCETKLHPEFTGKEIAGVIGVPPRTVYRYIAEMRREGRMPQAA